MLFPWSKRAVRAFWSGAHLAPGRLDVRRGMDAALVADAPYLAPFFAALWVESITDPQVMKPILFRVRQNGQDLMVHASREFLFHVLCLVPSLYVPGDEDENVRYDASIVVGGSGADARVHDGGLVTPGTSASGDRAEVADGPNIDTESSCGDTHRTVFDDTTNATDLGHAEQ